MATASKKPIVGMSLDDFRKKHDKNIVVPAKIKAALDALGDRGEYEVDFMRRAQISPVDLVAFREQFEHHYVTVGGKNPKRVWFGSAAVAAEARESVF